MPKDAALQRVGGHRSLAQNILLEGALLAGICFALASIPAAARAGTVNYTYDALGRVKTVQYDNVTVTYTYDAAGNRTSVVTTAPSTTGASAPAKRAEKKQS